MPVARAGFEHADRDVGILAQAIGKHASSGAGTDDHVIERVHVAAYSAAATALGSV